MGSAFSLVLGAILLWSVATGRAGKVFTAATGFAPPQLPEGTGTSGQGPQTPPGVLGMNTAAYCQSVGGVVRGPDENNRCWCVSPLDPLGITSHLLEIKCS